MSRAQQLIEGAEELLTRSLRHRLFREVGGGTVSAAVFGRYLLLERGFVETACRLHGMAVWDAPTGSALAAHVAAQQHLVTDQLTFFERAVADLPAAAVSEAARSRAEVLHRFALDAARDGGFAGVVTCLFAAEHLYRTWCAEAATGPDLPDGVVGEWVRLHAAEPFLAGVRDLAAEVDALSGCDESRLADWFTGMLVAELEFHDAAYLDG